MSSAHLDSGTRALAALGYKQVRFAPVGSVLLSSHDLFNETHLNLTAICQLLSDRSFKETSHWALISRLVSQLLQFSPQ
jgi:hypothetical protein